MKRILLVCVAVVVAGAAQAQHVHQKGPNGGTLEDVAGIHLELVASGRSIALNVFDDAVKPISSEGIVAKALVTSGSDRETVTLVESENALKGETKKDVAPGATVSVTLKTPSGKSGQAKFKN